MKTFYYQNLTTERKNSLPSGSSLFQPKLAINDPNDQYEKEADAVADKVLEMKVPSIQTKAANLFFKPDPIAIKLQRSEIGEEETAAHDNLESHVGNPNSSGEPLSNEVRNFYEPRFGYDFSNVKVHTDTVAARSAQSINALAYTLGNNIVFNNGRYSPETHSGKRLLGHELTHVVQQENGMRKIQRDAIPADLKLPCKWGDYSFEDNTINGIRILIAMDEADRKSLPPLKSIAAQIESDNKIISDPKFQVKICIISPNTTRFALYLGEPALMIDPADAGIDTIRHELGHAVFHFISHNKDAKINKQVKAEDWITNLVDIFLQLQGITLKKDKDNSITANFIVDPSEWKPGTKPEHPGDVDEFFASAKEAYQTDKKALKNTFVTYAKQNKKVSELGDRLLSLLEFSFAKGKLSKQAIGSDADKIKGHLVGIGEPSKVEDTLGAHQLADMLLDPDKRKACK